MHFDPHVALNYSASMARPRRVGSGEDEKVAREIEDRLRRWGYHVERQLFTFSTAPQVLLKVVIFSGLLLVLVMLAAYERLPLVADVAAIVLSMLVVAFMPLNHRVQAKSWHRTDDPSSSAYHSERSEEHLRRSAVSRADRLPTQHPVRRIGAGVRQAAAFGIAGLIKQYATANLIANLPGADLADVPELYLVAHYDSKSQRMPLAMRMALFMLTILFGLMLVALTLLNVSSVLYFPIGWLVLAAGVPLLFLDVGNHSPGAIDNASGVGLVLHLAEVLAQREDWRDRLRVTILVPGAEEMTLMGSVAFVMAHEPTLRQQAKRGGLFILNFDGIGVDGDLYYVGNSRRRDNRATINLLDQVQRACRELRVPLKRFGFVGALFDHLPFAQHGFDAISLVSVGPASRTVHTPQDSVDKLHVRGFDQAGHVALRVIERLTTDDIE